MKKKTVKRKTYKKCVRCGSVAAFTLDMGRMGRLDLCAVCWIGLAGAMARDFSIFSNFGVDYVAEMHKAYQREEWLKKNNK